MQSMLLGKVLEEVKKNMIPYNVLARKILIALSDGHGDDTAGKRTPIFPEGGFMHENEFNERVVNILKVELERCGFGVLLVAPTGADTPLRTRTDLANARKADLYLSVHANAFTGKWGTANGIETFTKGSGESLRIGKIIHAEVMKGTKFTDRGMKVNNALWEMRGTNMPAVLVEYGFMDNLREARLLKSEAYRQECAIETAKGVCKAFGVKYVPAKSSSPAPPSNGSYVVSKEKGIVEVLVDNLNVRSDANFSAKIVKVLKKGQRYKAYALKNGMRNLGGDQWVSAGSQYTKFTGEKVFVPAPAPKPVSPKTLYRVQVGAFGVKSNADKLKKELENKGFTAITVFETPLYKVQVGAYGVKANADAQVEKLKKAGYKPFVTS